METQTQPAQPKTRKTDIIFARVSKRAKDFFNSLAKAERGAKKAFLKLIEAKGYVIGSDDL